MLLLQPWNCSLLFEADEPAPNADPLTLGLRVRDILIYR